MTPPQRSAVLTIARRALEEEVLGRSERAIPPAMLPAEFGGVFVTLRKGGRLRGCMGTFHPLGTLADTVDQVTRTSVRDDPRFASLRITPAEVDDVRIEVSVLDTPRATDRPAELKIGRDGVLIRRGSATGCLLPQVAVERGWGAEEFLRRCCTEKAGLPADAWKDRQTEVLLFTVEAVGETGEEKASTGAGG